MASRSRSQEPRELATGLSPSSSNTIYFAEHTDRFQKMGASLIQQAERQLRVLPGDAVLEWHVSNPHGAAAIERLLVDNNITDITVIYTPRR